MQCGAAACPMPASWLTGLALEVEHVQPECSRLKLTSSREKERKRAHATRQDVSSKQAAAALRRAVIAELSAVLSSPLTMALSDSSASCESLLYEPRTRGHHTVCLRRTRDILASVDAVLKAEEMRGREEQVGSRLCRAASGAQRQGDGELHTRFTSAGAPLFAAHHCAVRGVMGYMGSRGAMDVTADGMQAR